MSHWRPTCLIGDPSETYMPYRILYASLKTDIPDWRPTCLIGYPSKTDIPDQRPTCLIDMQTCLIEYPSQTEKLDWKPMEINN